MPEIEIFSEAHGPDFDLIVCGTPGPKSAERFAPVPATVTACPRCGGCVLCGHADACPDPTIEISGDPGKSQCAIIGSGCCPLCASDRREHRFDMPDDGGVRPCWHAWHDQPEPNSGSYAIKENDRG